MESRVPWKRASSSSAPRLWWRWWWRRRRLPMQGATARHRHGAKLWFLRPRRRRTKSPNAGGKGARKRRETAPGARLRVATLTDLAGMAVCVGLRGRGRSLQASVALHAPLSACSAAQQSGAVQPQGKGKVESGLPWMSSCRRAAAWGWHGPWPSSNNLNGASPSKASAAQALLAVSSTNRSMDPTSGRYLVQQRQKHNKWKYTGGSCLSCLTCRSCLPCLPYRSYLAFLSCPSCLPCLQLPSLRLA